MHTPRHVYPYSAAAFTAVLLAGCTSATTSVVEPSTNKCTITASTSATAFSANGGSGTLTVNADRECDWSVTAGASWVAVQHPTGQGDAQIPFAVSANASQAARTTLLHIGDVQIGVTQAAAPRPAPPPTPAPAPSPAPTPTPAPKPPVPSPTPLPPSPPAPTPDPPTSVSLRGIVSGASGRCPTVSFTVQNQAVQASEATDYRKGRCRDLRAGAAVLVEGTRRGSAAVEATRIQFTDDDDNDDDD